MGGLDRIRLSWDPLGFVGNLVEQEWVVPEASSEKECEDSLYEFLHNRLDLQIVRQYGRGRARVDLMVQEKVMIELKYKLTTTSEYQRLLGQIMDYKDWKRQLLLVLVADVEPSLLKDLTKHLEEQFSPIWVYELGYRIVRK